MIKATPIRFKNLPQEFKNRLEKLMAAKENL